MYTTSGRLGSFKRSMVNEPAAPAEGYYLEGDLGQPGDRDEALHLCPHHLRLARSPCG